MNTVGFIAFYPSLPIWVGDRPDLSTARSEAHRSGLISEEVFSDVGGSHSVRVDRDGRILIRAERLERSLEDHELPNMDMEDNIFRLGEYLNLLNAFYILLDSAVVELQKIQLFSLHEITMRDVIRVHMTDDGKLRTENTATESVTASFQRFRSGPIEGWASSNNRYVVSIEAIRLASENFRKAVNNGELIGKLASLAKSVSEYKGGNFQTAVILSWFIIEAGIFSLWQNFLSERDVDLGGGRRRVNSKRRKDLLDRSYTSSVVSNVLELSGVIPYEEFHTLDKLRRLRNDIVHGAQVTVRLLDAEEAIRAACRMAERQLRMPLRPGLGYSMFLLR